MDVHAHFQRARNVISVPPGVILFAEGDPGTQMYVLMEGEADISVGGEVVEQAVPPAFLGELALIDQPVRSATVTSRTSCKLVAVDKRQFDLLVQEQPEFAREVMKSMANRLRAMNARLLEALGEISVHGRNLRR